MPLTSELQQCYHGATRVGGACRLPLARFFPAKHWTRSRYSNKAKPVTIHKNCTTPAKYYYVQNIFQRHRLFLRLLQTVHEVRAAPSRYWDPISVQYQPKYQYQMITNSIQQSPTGLSVPKQHLAIQLMLTIIVWGVNFIDHNNIIIAQFGINKVWI